uniref:Uncharacterized protein n=1 Tax=Anguilla anguilla TaxID=7936 RepID=A0A0E9TIJ0_ANGAN
MLANHPEKQSTVCFFFVLNSTPFCFAFDHCVCSVVG